MAARQPTDRQFRYSNRPIRCSTQLSRYYGRYHEHSFGYVLLKARVSHPPRFRVMSTTARRFLHPFGRATALRLRGSSCCAYHFIRSGAVVRFEQINRNKTDRAMRFRRARTAFDYLVIHRYYGVHYENTLNRVFLVQFFFYLG